MAVSKRLRYEVLARDNHTCRYCGATAPDVKLVIDHVTPTALGGRDEPGNLVTACEPCNSGKTSTVPGAAVVADVAEDALRWAAAIKQAAAELEAQDGPKEEYRAVFKKAWNAWTWEHEGKRKTFDLDPNWRTSLERFRQAGLPASVWPDIIEKAMAHKTVLPSNLFRYCCGVGWRMVTDLQERAKAIVGATVPSPETPEASALVEAAVEIWVGEWTGKLPDETGRAFEASVAEARDNSGEEYHRIIEAAQYAAWWGLSDITTALSRLDRDEIRQAWDTAWLARSGDYPGEEATQMVDRQIDELLKAGLYRHRIIRAAIHAGASRSEHLCFGLSQAEMDVIGGASWLIEAVNTWAAAYRAATWQWPSTTERADFSAAASGAVADGKVLLTDMLSAATTAGLTQDTQVLPSLTRLGSVFEAAMAIPVLPSTE